MEFLLVSKLFPANYLQREQAFLSCDKEITLILPKNCGINHDKPLLIRIEQEDSK